MEQRKEPILDAHLSASVDQASGVHNENGHYATLVYTGCDTRERAKEIVRALHRSGQTLGSKSVSATVKPAVDGTFNVEYKAINKEHARAYVLEKYGTDRVKMAVRPRRKGNALMVDPHRHHAETGEVIIEELPPTPEESRRRQQRSQRKLKLGRTSRWRASRPTAPSAGKLAVKIERSESGREEAIELEEVHEEIRAAEGDGRSGA